MSPSAFAASIHARRTAARWTSRVGSAILVSALAHAALAVTAGAILGRSVLRRPAESQNTLDLDVDIVPPPSDEALGLSDGLPAFQAKPGPGYRQAAALRRSRARTTPIAATAIGATAIVSITSLAKDDVEPARFALSAGTVATRPPLAAAGATSGSGAVVSRDDTVLSEGEVSVPARLVASSPLLYPAAARNAEIEIDLPVEIVVDTSGRVRSARGLTRAGYGLDEAALQAIRRYRFCAALRDGRSVSVRMRWTVQFRLR